MWNSALWVKFNLFFFKTFLLILMQFSFWQEDCGHYTIILWGLDTFLIFPNFLGSYKSQFVWQLMRQLIYTMFISNNCASFYYGGSQITFFLKPVWLPVQKLWLDHILTKINKKIGCNPGKGCQPCPFLPNTCCRAPKWANFQAWANILISYTIWKRN